MTAETRVSVEQAESWKRPLVDLIDDPDIRERVARVCQQYDDAINAMAVMSVALRKATALASSNRSEGGQSTVAFVQEWLMNADYDPSKFDRDFAAAIDARCAAPVLIETDASGEAMVCTGCGTTRTVAAIRASSPTAFTCCPERKMIPVRDAIAPSAGVRDAGVRDAGVRDAGREAIARAIASKTYAFAVTAEEGSDQYDCGEWEEMGRFARLTYLDAADSVLALTARPDGETVAIPAGMVAWHGRTWGPPKDHDFGPVMQRDGKVVPSPPTGNFWMHVASHPNADIIAYTPSPTTNAGGEREDKLYDIETLLTPPGNVWTGNEPAWQVEAYRLVRFLATKGGAE